HVSDRRLVVELEQEIEAAATDVPRLPADRLDESRRRVERFVGWGRKVELDPFPAARRGQNAAARVEARGRLRRELSVLPQHVRAGEGGVAAQIDSARGWEPPR